MNGITASRNTISAASLMSRATRPTVQGPAIPAGGETTTAISLPSGSTLTSVSPRSAPSPAPCISLVSATTQASHDNLGLHPPPSPRACRQQQVLASEQLASLPDGSTTGYGYTGSVVTQASSVQLHCPPSGAAAAATAGPQSSHRTEVGAIVGSAHATTTTPATSTYTSPASVAAAAVLTTTAMCTSGSGPPPLPSASAVRVLLDTAAPHMSLDDGFRVIPLPTTHHRLQRTYELRATATPAAGDHGCGVHGILVLALAPPSMLRLLRSEQWIIKSEAVVVRWIRSVLLSAGGPGGSSSSQGAQRSGIVEGPDLSYTDVNVCGWCGTKRQHCQARIHDELSPGDADLLLGLLPALVGHSQSGRDLGAAYNILSHPAGGIPLSSLSGGLTAPERRHVDFQAGRLARRLSLLRSPSGRFGPAMSVLSSCPAAAAATQQGRAAGGGGGSEEERPGGGADRWSLAFHALLEGVLRDAEDMAVTISYQAIRRHFRRLRSCLDAVTVARLVILDAAHDSNVMAERKAPTQDRGGKAGTEPTELISEPDSEDSSGEGGGGLDGGRYPAGIRLTGLRDWGNCTFGDPLMAMAFSEEPSGEFLRGFSGRGQQSRSDEDDDDAYDVLTMCGDIVEHPEEAHVRLLLYQCYHATVAVVKEFYRPQAGSTDRELAARKRLHAVLARLEDIEDDDPKRRHARPFGEMSPAKKPKTEGEQGEDDSNNDYEQERV